MSKIRFLILSLLLLSACNDPNSPTNQIQQERQELVVEYFTGDDEKSVVDATWSGSSIFKILMFDDGSNRNGFAQYVCEVLNQFDFKNKKITVQVFNALELTKNKRWVKMGDASCVI